MKGKSKSKAEETQSSKKNRKVKLHKLLYQECAIFKSLMPKSLALASRPP